MWVALGWGGVETTGGVLPPGVGGGSAQGKSPIPNDYIWERLDHGVKIADAPPELYDLAVQAYAQRRARGVTVLRLLQQKEATREMRQKEATREMLVTTGQIRPITDWIGKWCAVLTPVSHSHTSTRTHICPLCPPPSCALHPPGHGNEPRNRCKDTYTLMLILTP